MKSGEHDMKYVFYESMKGRGVCSHFLQVDVQQAYLCVSGILQVLLLYLYSIISTKLQLTSTVDLTKTQGVYVKLKVFTDGICY